MSGKLGEYVIISDIAEGALYVPTASFSASNVSYQFPPMPPTVARSNVGIPTAYRDL
jgi:hypothetical protein